MIFNRWDKYRDFGLLLLRIGIGIMFILHGYPKLAGGPQKWEAVGSAMQNLYITFGYTFWGFMAAFAEFFGGTLLMLGWFFRPAAILLFITMAVAYIKHIAGADGFNASSHAAESAILFLGLIFIGPGRFSLDAWWQKRKTKNFD